MWTRSDCPNPVLSTIKYFRDEYDAHIRDKKCPAGVCSELLQYTIDEVLCKACGLCKRFAQLMLLVVNAKYPML